MTDDDMRWVDGNGIAGVLAEVFETEMTTARRVCQSCGKENAIGAHRAYRGAGWVLRCPSCEDVAARIAVMPDRHVVHMEGRWLIDIVRTG